MGHGVVAPRALPGQDSSPPAGPLLALGLPGAAVEGRLGWTELRRRVAAAGRGRREERHTGTAALPPRGSAPADPSGRGRPTQGRRAGPTAVPGESRESAGVRDPDVVRWPPEDQALVSVRRCAG